MKNDIRYHKTGYTVEVINDYGKRITSWHKKLSIALRTARDFIPYVKNLTQIEIITNSTGNSFIPKDTWNFKFVDLTFDLLEKRIQKRLKYPKA